MTRPLRAAALLTLLLPGTSFAQTVSGSVVEAGTARPVWGAFVVLLDAAGTQRAGVLTDTAGRFAVRARASGTYTLRVERIGHGSTTAGPFQLQLGRSLRQRIEVPLEAVTLDALTVSGASRCVLRPGTGERTHQLWEEARKALRMTAWSETQGYRFQTVTFHTAHDREGRRRKRAMPDTVAGYARKPFVTLPAADLAEHGYVHESEGSYTYYAPDAEVLLSDAFLDSHCFRLQEPGAGREGQVGLAFEPVRPAEHADVAGVLWLDRETAALRALEFRYTRLPWAVPLEEFGGELHFRRLPTGAWITQRWRIRFPRIMSQRTFAMGRLLTGKSNQLDGYEIVGGEVIRLLAADGTPLPAPGTAALSGIVYDSTRMAPLARAVVWLEGSGHSAGTDSLGRFRIDALPAGEYTVGFTHPRADSLEVEPAVSRMALGDGVVESVTLALPSLATLWARGCGGGAAETAVLVGRVAETLTGEPLAGVPVVAEWEAEAGQAAWRTEARTDADGVYRVCAAPAGARATVTASLLGARASASAVAGEGEVARRDLQLALQRPARVIGRVLDLTGSTPVVGAEIRLAGTTLRVSTDSAGAFAFPNVPPGTHTLEVRHVAYGTRTDTVAVRAGHVAELVVGLRGEAIALAAIEVRVASRPLLAGGKLREFEERRQHFGRLGLGRFLGREEIERRQAGRATDLFRGMAGVRLIKTGMGAGNYAVRMVRAPTGLGDPDSNDCGPAIYVDGMKVLAGDAFLASFPASELEGVEVYAGTAQIPMEYGGSDARCGVIALWTRRK